MHVLSADLDRRTARISRWLALHSIPLLRVSLGFVFLGFGVLKFFPGVSPAEGLATATMGKLTLGLIPGGAEVLLVAALETAIGLSFVTGRFLRLGLLLLGVAMVGVMSPLVLFPGQLFAGPANAPTLEGQYVLKDVVLLAAGLVVAAGGGGGRVVAERDEAAASEPQAGQPAPTAGRGYRLRPQVRAVA